MQLSIKENRKRVVTKPMNEWGFIGLESLVVVGNTATNCKFINWCGYEHMARLVLSNPHSS